jgi:hypothetical protein
MKTLTQIHIFRHGTQRPMAGGQIVFSEADLLATAAAYDPAKHEAPIVIGHPKTDDPAYGWISSLTSEGGQLDATPTQVDPAFAELFKAGRYKKISAAFYTPDSPSNPVPGVYYLKHVGFLGATPPAIKGLRQAQFAANDTGVVEFADWADVQNASLWRGLRDFFISKFGLDDADKVLPAWTIQNLEESAKNEPSQMPFSEPENTPPTNPPIKDTVTPEQKAALEAENASIKKQLAELTQAQTQATQVKIEAEQAAFAEGLVATGKLAPKDVPCVLAVMGSLQSADKTVEFGEGAAKTTLVQKFQEFLKSGPKVVAFGEIATAENANGEAAAAETAYFGEHVDADRLQQHNKIIQHMAAHKTDYATAARTVMKGA